MDRIVFWQPGLSLHWSSVIRSLADHATLEEVILVAHEGLTDRQRAIGKYEPDFGKAKVVIAPSEREIADLVHDRTATSVHVFSAFRTFPTVRQGFDICVQTNALMGVFSEPGDHRGWKGQVRRLQRWTEFVRHGKRLNFILAAGEMGIKWFRSCGFPGQSLYKFAYFVEGPAALMSEYSVSRPNDQFHIVFVGQMIHRKGIDLLLNALSQIREKPWKATIAGSGISSAELRNLASTLAVADRIDFVDALPNRDAIHLMSTGDIFILPSRFDGWGAVVNEALMVGVPVICSDACGAADLLANIGCGAVFPSESVSQLSYKLSEWIDRGPRTAAERTALKNWSNCICAETAANYLTDILNSVAKDEPHPVAPWDIPFDFSGASRYSAGA